MRRMLLPLLFCITMLALYPARAHACTSFAVYREDTLYGMDFDYSDVPIRYVISQNGGTAVFHVDFEAYGRYVPIAGMNEHGLFLAVQMLYPEALKTPGQDEEELHAFAQEALFNMRSVEEALRALEHKRVVNSFLMLHCMLADKNGTAIVLEPGDGENRITQNPGDYLVMTNFFNADFYHPDTQRMENVDCTRYLAAENCILQGGDAFSVADGMETLKSAMQKEGDYPTQNSIVCDPVNGELYIAIRGDFETVWKVSLKEKTIESFRGIAKPIKLELGEEGISAQTLVDLKNEAKLEPPSQQAAAANPSPQPPADAPAPGKTGLAGVDALLLCLGILCVVIAWRLFRKKKGRPLE